MKVPRGITSPNPLPPRGAPLRLGILDLEPVWRASRAVTRPQPLRDNALAHLACVKTRPPERWKALLALSPVYEH
jgi:hypothetical protein